MSLGSSFHKRIQTGREALDSEFPQAVEPQVYNLGEETVVSQDEESGDFRGWCEGVATSSPDP